jgi:hypothetical protein
MLGSDSYLNGGNRNIIGCACTDIYVDPLLETIDFYAILKPIAGAFGVSAITALIYDADNGLGNSLDAVGTIRGISPVPIPATVWLFASALGVFGYRGKRKAQA